MKVHAIAVDEQKSGVLKTSVTSCYCRKCLNGDFCAMWTYEKFEYSIVDGVVNSEDGMTEQNGANALNPEESSLKGIDCEGRKESF